jgi:5' nucleotidase, deoxy (Pyrimidine), cytosolic type C protein (NT5C)
MKPVCYLDLDGVLVDFHKGVMAFHRHFQPYETLTWDIWDSWNMSAEAFWGPLGYDFWLNLPWTPEGKTFLQGVEKVFKDRIVITTSPCWTPGCAQGKLDWIKREIPHLFRSTSIGPAKHLLAGPGKLLIDDSDSNIKLFVDEGGTAIRVPRPWNVAKPSCLAHGTFDVVALLREVEEVYTWLTKE